MVAAACGATGVVDRGKRNVRDARAMLNQLFTPIYALAVLAVVQGADVRYVANSCDVIAVGEVTTRTESATSVSFDINVQRVLKGLAVSGPLARFASLDPAPRGTGPRPVRGDDQLAH
jgi:hypothetical protein